MTQLELGFAIERSEINLGCSDVPNDFGHDRLACKEECERLRDILLCYYAILLGFLQKMTDVKIQFYGLKIEIQILISLVLFHKALYYILIILLMWHF